MNDSVQQTYGAEKPSYYVYREGGRSPTKAHPNRFSAMKEAKRLADKDAGATYHVLKVRATFVNTDPLPQGEIDNFAKQMKAREGMAAGSIVVVNKDHFRFANEIGYIDRLGDGDDTSVYVNIVGDVQRFSPSSLTLRSKPAFDATASEERPTLDDAETADDSRPEGSGGFLGLLGALLAASLVRARQRAAEEAIEAAYEKSPEGQAEIARVRAIPVGTDVYVIGEGALAFMPDVAFPGKLLRFDADPKFVWIGMVDPEGSVIEEVQANVSRVKRADDPELVLI